MHCTNPRDTDMAQELLVGDHLTADMISTGSLVIKSLDTAKVGLKAAFWRYMPDERTWRLFLVSPQVRNLGPTAVYRKVNDAIAKMPIDALRPTTNDISVLDDKSTMYTRIRSLLSDPSSSSGVRLVRSSASGKLADDLFVYRAN